MPNKAAAGKGAKTTGESQRRASSDVYRYVRGRANIGSVSQVVARSIEREAAMHVRCPTTARELSQSAGGTQAFVRGLLTFKD
jgi:hypothetical protein